MPARNDANTVVVSLAVSIAGLDQLMKAAVDAAIGSERPGSRIEIGNGWVALEYTENRGAAFGLFPGFAPFLVVASIVVMVGLLAHYLRESRPTLWTAIGIGAIAGGAIGNLIDRIRLGYVIDFVSIGPWPNFNVADSAITVGVMVLIWGWMRPQRDASPRFTR